MADSGASEGRTRVKRRTIEGRRVDARRIPVEDEWTTGGAWCLKRVECRVPNGWTCCAIKRDVSSIYAQCQPVRDCDCRPLGGDERARINAIHTAACGRAAAASRPRAAAGFEAQDRVRPVSRGGRCRPTAETRSFSAASCGSPWSDGATAQAKRNALRGKLRSRSSTGTRARRRCTWRRGLATSRPAESRRTLIPRLVE